MILFTGDHTTAYRDPACFYFENCYHLFFTLSIKKNGYLYNHIAVSQSSDLLHWSVPKVLTETDNCKNYCSPGCILAYESEYWICFSSYPMPIPYAECPYADNTARLFFMRTKDFVTFSQPEKIYAKGIHCSFEDEGRMIDPYLLKADNGKYILFFKQNGVSMSVSNDMQNWQFVGSVDGGENACVLPFQGQYMLVHSPSNGIGFKASEDLVHWKDAGNTTLDQSSWDWASGRLTAGFAMESRGNTKYKYLLFFHGSRHDAYPETHGNATLAVAFTDNFEEYFYYPY